MNAQASEVSALFDGELEPHEIRPALRAAVGDEAMRERWQAYVLIGDQLRGESVEVSGMAASVMARIAEEPVVLAPRNLKRPTGQHPMLALAASVAGVAVVGWLALTGNPQSAPADMRTAAVSPASTLAMVTKPVAPVRPEANVQSSKPAAALRSDMSEYLLAHQTQSASFRLGDGVQQVRAVTLADSAVRP